MNTLQTRYTASCIFLIALATAASGWWLFCRPPVSSAAESPRPAIVIDPGHGGNDSGAAGGSAGVEKDICLTLAQMIYIELESTYRIVLTRNADYTPELFTRTQTANQSKASTFVSLHTGASVQPHANGVTVFYYSHPALRPSSPSDTTTGAEGLNSLGPTHWEHAQWRYLSGSQKLAGMVGEHLSNDLTDVPVTVQGAPVAVLAGANMPAVMVEIGYLSHPKEARNLKNRDTLEVYAKSISSAVQAFLSQHLNTE
ncbi:MAG: N-acetylmuramoyl-L-alanine amidase [Desulfobacteraceae bacterium]|nr:N-acetylmuramoyl-L-alanine amidase [Desulfobacteraceae bacterium]